MNTRTLTKIDVDFLAITKLASAEFDCNKISFVW